MYMYIYLPFTTGAPTTRVEVVARLYYKIQDFSRFIWKHSDTYTSVTRGHFLNNIYIQDMTEWTYDEK